MMNHTPSLLELITEVKNIKESTNTLITEQLDTLNTTIETLSSDLTAKTDTLTESVNNLDTKVDEKVAEVTTSVEANKEAIAKTDAIVAANTQAIEDNKILLETTKTELEQSVVDTKTELDTKKQNKLVAGNSGNITLVDNVDDNTTTIDVDLTKVATTDALNQEIADRTQADTDLETNLTTKIDDAKTEIKTYVDTEVSKVDGKIDVVISKIETDTETYDDFVADTTNFLAKKSYVDSEIAKIKDVSGDNVNDLLEKINKNSDDILANKALIDTNTANITTNSNSITNLSNALATEVTNRTDADTALDTRVTKLEQDVLDATDAYKAADTALETKMTDAYKAADDTLKTDITTAYEAADSKLNTDLTNLINTKQDILTAGANITIVDNEISATYEFDSTNIEKRLKDLEDNKLDTTNIVNHLGDTLKLEPKLVGGQAVQTLDVVLDNDATPTTSAASVSKVDTLVNKKQNKLVAGTGIVLTDNADTTTIAVNQTDSIDSITASEPITFKEVKTDKVVTGREIALKIGVGLEKSATGHLRINTNKVVTVDKLGDLTTLTTTKKDTAVNAINELVTVDTGLSNKIDELNTNLALKADTTYVDDSINALYTIKRYGESKTLEIKVGDVVLSPDNKLYVCKVITDYNTNNWNWSKDVENNFAPVDSDTINTIIYNELTTGDEVTAGKLVVNNNTIYIVTTTFNKSGWDTDVTKMVESGVNVDLSLYYTKDNLYTKTELDNLFKDVDTKLDAKSQLQVPVAQPGASYKAGQLLLKVAPSSDPNDEGYPPTVYITTQDISNYGATTHAQFLKKVVDDETLKDVFTSQDDFNTTKQELEDTKNELGTTANLSTDLLNDDGNPGTVDTTTVVDAINNLNTKLDNKVEESTDSLNALKDNVGDVTTKLDTSLTNSSIDPTNTNPTTVVDAINNLKKVSDDADTKLTADITKVSNDLTTEVLARQETDKNLAELESNVGDLTALGTTNKNSIVEAVNELDTAYKAADTALETKITKAYTDADNHIKGLLTNLDNEVVKKTDIATTTKLGIVKPGDNINIDATGTISVGKATTTTLGLIKVGTGLSVDTDGLLTTTVYEDASKIEKGIVQVGDNIEVTAGVISIPKATDTSLGVVKPGKNISVDTDGAISSTTVVGELVDGVTYPAGQIGIISDGGKKKLVRLTKEYPYTTANQDTALTDGTMVIITDTTTSADSGHIEYFVANREVTNGGFIFYRGCVFKVTADKINLSAGDLDKILTDVINTGTDNSTDYDMVFGLTPGDGVSIDKIGIGNASGGINNKVSVKKATTSTLGGVVVGSGLNITDGVISNKSNLMLIGFSEYVGTIPVNTIVKYGNTLYLTNTEFNKTATTSFDDVKTNLTPITSSDTSIIKYNDLTSPHTIKAGQLLTYTATDGTTKLYVATKDITIDNTDKDTQFTNSLANGDIAASSVTGDLEDITKQIQAQVATKANLVVPTVTNSTIKTGQLFVNNNQLYIAKTDIPQNGSLTTSNSQLVVDLSSYATTDAVNTGLSKKMDLIPTATAGNKYSVGQLVLVGDVLYRVKTAITSYATTDVSTKLVKIVDLSATDAKITALETKVNSNTTNLTNLTTRVTTAEGKITTNTTDITTLKTKTGIDNISTIDTAINANGANGDLVTIIKELYTKVKSLETELSKYLKTDYLDSIVYSANTILELTDSSSTFVYNNTTKTAKVGTKQTFTIATDATSVGLTSSNTAAATAAISGKVLTITPVAAGSTTITLTATASGKSQATFKLIFTVSA